MVRAKDNEVDLREQEALKKAVEDRHAEMCKAIEAIIEDLKKKVPDRSSVRKVVQAIEQEYKTYINCDVEKSDIGKFLEEVDRVMEDNKKTLDSNKNESSFIWSALKWIGSAIAAVVVAVFVAVIALAGDASFADAASFAENTAPVENSAQKIKVGGDFKAAQKEFKEALKEVKAQDKASTPDVAPDLDNKSTSTITPS